MRRLAAVAGIAFVVLLVVTVVVTLSGDDIDEALIIVNTSADELDAAPNTTCSLREAIASANQATAVGGCSEGADGLDTIAFAPGTRPVLSIAGPPEDLNARGDLDIRSPIRIAGPAGSGVPIDGARIDRVFDVRPDGSLRLDNVTVRGGNPGHDAGGGGVRNEGRLELHLVTVTDNIAGASGGGIQNAGTMTADRSTISGNRAARGGGFANVSLANATLRALTVSGNQATSEGAGGVDVQSGEVAIDAGTITLNTKANGGVGGVFSGVLGGVTLSRTIVADNADPQCGEGPTGGVVSGGFNLASDATCASGPTDIVDRSPRLGPLTANGGPTETHLPEPGSPAIDAVPEGECGAIDIDQRGGLRPQLEGRPCDIGAVEIPAPADATSTSVTTSTLGVPAPTTTAPTTTPPTTLPSTAPPPTTVDAAGTTTTDAPTTDAPTTGPTSTTRPRPTTTSSTTTTTTLPETRPAPPTDGRPLRPPAPPTPGEPTVTG